MSRAWDWGHCVRRFGEMLCQHRRAPTWDDVSEFTRSATTLRTGILTMHAGKQRCSAAHDRMIKDAIANIARDREVLHFLSCITHLLGHLSGLPTNRPSGFPDTGAFIETNLSLATRPQSVSLPE